MKRKEKEQIQLNAKQLDKDEVEKLQKIEREDGRVESGKKMIDKTCLSIESTKFESHF